MILCFGVYANILRHAMPKPNNIALVCALVKTIDKKHNFRSPGKDQIISKIMNCKYNFPSTEITVDIDDDEDKYYGGNTTSTRIMQLFRDVSLDVLAESFENSILKLFSEDKKSALIGALKYVIANDESLHSNNKQTFESCMGMSLEQAESDHVEVILPRFLAGIFLYTLFTNDNKHTEGQLLVKEIGKPEFWNQFETYRITYTNESIKGFVPAPDDFGTYLEHLRNKHSSITTLIYKGIPHPFYDVFVPGTVAWQDAMGHHAAGNVGIEKALSISQALILSGRGGTGKSVMMQHLLLDAIDKYPQTHCVPIFISLKDIDFAVDDILQCAHYFTRHLMPDLSMDELQTMFIDGKTILFFDGLDEINVSYLKTFTSALEAFLDRYTDNALVLSSRPGDHFAFQRQCVTLEMQPFTKEEAISLVAKLDYPQGKPEINEEFRKELENGMFERHLGYSDNPLLLTIMLMTYEEHKEIPSKMHLFYQQAYQVLANLHDESKGGFERPLAMVFDADEFAKYFSFFCARSYRKTDYAFTDDKMAQYFLSLQKKYGIENASVHDFTADLCKNICLMQHDNIRYSFIHRSFQEYFFARYFYLFLKDKTKLNALIPLFDRTLERKNDIALPMLFDMDRDAVTQYLIVPYLKELIEKCENNDGIWTFFETLYPNLECSSGEVPENVNDEPVSALYSFIRNQYDIPHPLPAPPELLVIGNAVFEAFVFRKDTEKIVSSTKLPAGYADRYGKPEVVGCKYTFDWDALKESSEGNMIIADKSSPFHVEYDAVKRLCSELASAETDDEDDLFDD